MTLSTELPRQIMDDLAMVYLSSEASSETRELVEQYAASHPDYAAVLQGALAETPAPAVATIPREDEMAALKRTKEYLFLRTLFLAMAVAFTLSLGLFTFSERGIEFLLYRDAPGAFWAFASVGAASWVAWGTMRRELSKSGL